MIGKCPPAQLICQKGLIEVQHHLRLLQVFLLSRGGSGRGPGGEPGLGEQTAIYCPLFLNSSEGLDGISAVAEMELAVKEQSRSGLTHVAGGTQ